MSFKQEQVVNAMPRMREQPVKIYRLGRGTCPRSRVSINKASGDKSFFPTCDLFYFFASLWRKSKNNRFKRIEVQPEHAACVRERFSLLLTAT